jgi:hypothetical protein
MAAKDKGNGVCQTWNTYKRVITVPLEMVQVKNWSALENIVHDIRATHLSSTMPSISKAINVPNIRQSKQQIAYRKSAKTNNQQLDY